MRPKHRFVTHIMASIANMLMQFIDIIPGIKLSKFSDITLEPQYDNQDLIPLLLRGDQEAQSLLRQLLDIIAYHYMLTKSLYPSSETYKIFKQNNTLILPKEITYKNIHIAVIFKHIQNFVLSNMDTVKYFNKNRARLQPVS